MLPITRSSTHHISQSVLISGRLDNRVSIHELMGYAVLYGMPAVKLVGGETRQHFQKKDILDLSRHTSMLEYLYRPKPNYEHVASCLHGNTPSATIQGSQDVWQSVYVRRCNGQYVNGAGKAVEEELPQQGCSLLEMEDIEESIRIGNMTVEDLANASWTRFQMGLTRRAKIE